MKRFVLASLCSLTCLAAHAARPRSDAALVNRGEELSRMICAACHVVADDQASPPRLLQPTPSFRDIADRPGTTAESLRKFVGTTHWDPTKNPDAMPNPRLSDEQITAISAYILSLKHK